MIKMVAFDLDGTIGDTIPFSIEAFQQAVSPYAGHRLSEPEIVKTFGLNEMGMIKAVTDSHWEKALHDFYQVYEKLHERCPFPYKGISSIFDLLDSNGIHVALIAGKGEKACAITLEKFGLMDRFCDIETGLENRLNKTEAIHGLLERYNLQKEEFYYVGDAVSDITASRNAGVICLSAAWGTPADLTELREMNAGRIFFTIKQLYGYLRNEITGYI